LEIKELIDSIHYNNDESAFNELYKLLINSLNQFAWSFLGDKEACEEIINDLFVNIWTGRHKLNKISNPKVYFYVAIKNACLNHIRSNTSKRNRDAQLAETYYFHLSVDPAQLLISKELEAGVLKAVNSLPPRCKLIFKMVKEDELSCNEVADILGLSNKTVFAQLAIALKKLDEALGNV
jgi:RNA polymerase sigma-70 factor (ECF subfamily)